MQRCEIIDLHRRKFLSNSLYAGLLATPSMLRKLSPFAGAEIASKIVDTDCGKLRGVMREGVSVYKGIPYGGPAGGAARFMPPTSVKPWAGVRDANAWGARCYPVKADLFNAWYEPTAPREDCLFLNVWTPAADGKKRPVMVYMHGGGFYAGSAGEAPYEGTHLAKKGDVVVVTVNHRLNIFGYLYLGGLSDKYAMGNVGQLDLVAALKWVRTNIDGFGGDATNVTIFGQSGGGGKVNTLMAMPSARGLFGKAINQSGAHLRGNSREEGNKVAEAVLAALELKPHQVDELQQVPVERLVAVTAAIVNQHDPRLNPTPFQPVVDGVTLSAYCWDPVAPAISADVPLMIGSTSGEAAAMLGNDIKNPPQDNADLHQRLRRNLANKVHVDDAGIDKLLAFYRKQYPGDSSIDLLIQISTDTAQFRNAILEAERKVAQQKAPVFMYEFDWKSPRLGGMWAYHCIDVPFVFDNLDIPFALDADNGDTTTNPESRAKADPQEKRFALAEKTVAAWVAFSRSGNPSNSRTGEWPAYTLERRATMIFDKECKVVDDPRSAPRQVVTALPG